MKDTCKKIASGMAGCCWCPLGCYLRPSPTCMAAPNMKEYKSSKNKRTPSKMNGYYSWQDDVGTNYS